MAYFEFSGATSEAMGLRIKNDVTHESSGKDVEKVVVPGRDGEVLLSNQRLKSVQMSFPCRLKVTDNLTKAQERISDWLSAEGYQDLFLSWDSQYVYRAAYLETFEIREILRQFGDIKINFLVHPIKYKRSSRIPKRIRNGETVRNDGNVIAKPFIRLIGTGDCVLTINGRKTKMTNIQGQIVLNMQQHQVYSGALSAWNKIVRAPEYVLPSLEIGNNRISWTGNFTVEIATYEGVKI